MKSVSLTGQGANLNARNSRTKHFNSSHGLARTLPLLIVTTTCLRVASQFGHGLLLGSTSRLLGYPLPGTSLHHHGDTSVYNLHPRFQPTSFRIHPFNKRIEPAQASPHATKLEVSKNPHRMGDMRNKGSLVKMFEEQKKGGCRRGCGRRIWSGTFGGGRVGIREMGDCSLWT